MSEPVVCPVCETPNDPEATNCEVCGERLTPPEPGEELAPEENVAAVIQEESEAIAGEPVEEAELELEPAGVDEDFDAEPLDAGFEDEVDDGDDVPADLPDEGDGAPDVLYSPLDGTAYPEGTPEFEEGFGPNGEELVAHLPDGVEPEGDLVEENYDEDDSHDELDEGEFDDGEFQDEGLEGGETGDHADEPEEAPADQTSEQFQQLFQPRQKGGAGAEPLPEPGVHAEPATLTVYLNRQPVHTHAIETDETLIGRRDPVSDAYPDLDLTEIDEASVVSRKHAYIFRQNRNYTLYVVSNAGTQVNADLLELGQRRPLEDGDVIVLAGSIAMKFELPD